MNKIFQTVLWNTKDKTQSEERHSGVDSRQASPCIFSTFEVNLVGVKSLSDMEDNSNLLGNHLEIFPKW